MGNMVVVELCRALSLDDIDKLLSDYSFNDKDKLLKMAIKDDLKKQKSFEVYKKSLEEYKMDLDEVNNFLNGLESNIALLTLYKEKMYSSLEHNAGLSCFRKREDSCIRLIKSSYEGSIDLDSYYDISSSSKIDFLNKVESDYNKSLNHLEDQIHAFFVSFINFIKVKEDISLSIHNKRRLKEYLKKYPNYLEQYDSIITTRKKLIKGKNTLLDLKKIIANSLKVKENKPLSFELNESDKNFIEDVSSYFKWIDSFSLNSFKFRDELIEYTSSLTKKINSLEKDEQKAFISVYLRLLKSRMRLSKDVNKSKYVILKSLKVVVNTYLKDDLEKQDDYYYDILKEFLDSNFNYIYIKNMLSSIDKFVDSREGEHILVLIVDDFIKNSKLKLVNQGFEYVDPEYLYQVFKLFFSNRNPLYEEEIEHISIMLDDFKNYLLSHKYKDIDKYLNYITSMMDISKNGIIKKQEQIDSKDYSFMILDSTLKKRVNLKEEYLDDIRSKISDTTLSFKEGAYSIGVSIADYENALSSTEVFMLNGGKYAYSFYFDEHGDSFLRVHVFDIRFLKDSSDISTILKNNSFKLEPLKTIPTITYQFKLFSNGLLGDLKYFESLVEIKNVYDINDFKNVNDLKLFISFIKRMNFEDGINVSEIEKFVEGSISDKIVDIFSKNNKAMIYTHNIEPLENQVIDNHYKICHKLMNLSKAESNIINKILRLPLGVGYSSDASSNSFVSVDSSTYLGFILQMALFSDLDLDFVNEEVERLNSSLGYVPKYFVKNEKYFVKKN